ncbi:hypothetical protein DMH04_40700 [Kibdelosporangium aridum]|uniref:Uncharacterized protein n=1 Tax=Kibdelosporangium aridum TaxID=2030 RepID=A0A428YVS7_KIBAR|nr:hypothetical protein [Kibdelosporangium aridum]RSM73875.1 hypothetical protein DMH04_40700 [Kibdelosporangium aridum]
MTVADIMRPFFRRKKDDESTATDWRDGRQVFRRPEATELSFSRLNFLRSADDHTKLRKSVARIYRDRADMDEKDVEKEYRDIQRKLGEI